MKAKGAFIVAGLFAGAGLIFMIMAYLGSGTLDRLQSAWPTKIKKIETSIGSDSFPSNAYVKSEKDHGRRMRDENRVIRERSQRFADDLTEPFSTAPRGEEDPGRFAIAWDEELTKLEARYAAVCEDYDWTDKNNIVRRLPSVPSPDEIPDLQARYRIFEAILAALDRHSAPAEGIDSNQRTLLTECLWELDPDRVPGEHNPYHLHRVRFMGAIPFPVLAAALHDLTQPAAAPGTDDRSLLVVPRKINVLRSESDPKEKSKITYNQGDPRPEVETAPPLQNQVIVELDVRAPVTYEAPQEVD